VLEIVDAVQAVYSTPYMNYYNFIIYSIIVSKPVLLINGIIQYALAQKVKKFCNVILTTKNKIDCLILSDVARIEPEVKVNWLRFN
jgi:hypothetical protein